MDLDVIAVACLGSENVALPGSALSELGARIAQDAPGVNYYLEDQVTYGALDQTMVSHGYNWCQRCAVFALHSPANSKDNLGPQALLQQCLAGGDSFLNAWSLPSGSPPDPNLRLDIASCQPCPAGQVSDSNGVCQVCNETVAGNACVQCPADEIIDGTTTPLGSESWETTTSVAGDVCPDIFWLEVRNPQASFTAGATSLTGFIGLDTITQATCQTAYSINFSDLPTGSTSFVVENTVTSTGTFSNNSLIPCSGLPSLSIASLSALTFGSSPIRFSTKSLSGVNFTFSAPAPIKPPQ